MYVCNTACLLLLNEPMTCPILAPVERCCCLSQSAKLGVQVARLPETDSGIVSKAAQANMHIESSLQVMCHLFATYCCVRLQHTTDVGNVSCHFLAADLKRLYIAGTSCSTVVSMLKRQFAKLSRGCTGQAV